MYLETDKLYYCPYCSGSDENGEIDKFIIDKTKGKWSQDVCITNNRILTSALYFGNEEVMTNKVKIKYCPMCGVKL